MSELKQRNYIGCSQEVMTFLPQAQFVPKYEHFGRGLESEEEAAVAAKNAELGFLWPFLGSGI